MKIEKKQQIRGPSENSGRTKTKWYRKKWLRVTAVCLVTVLVVSEFVIHYTAQQEIQTDFGPETLLDAQEHPEQYKHLVVRVAGYSALFTTLSKSLQDDIIRRTEQGF